MRRRTILSLLVVTLIIAAPFGTFTIMVEASRLPPFGVVWRTTTPLGDDLAYTTVIDYYTVSVGSNFTSPGACDYKVQATNTVTGSVYWTSPKFTIDSYQCVPGTVYPYGNTIYFIGVGNAIGSGATAIAVEEFDLSKGTIVSSTNTGSFPFVGSLVPQFQLVESGRMVYAVVSPEGTSTITVGALSLDNPGQLLWTMNLTAPEGVSWITEGPIVYADSYGLAVMPRSQVGVFEYHLNPAGELDFSGYLPAEGGGTLSPHLANDTLYYSVTGSDPRVIGIRLSDGNLAANFSVAGAVSVFGPISGLDTVDGRILVVGSNGTTAYSPAGTEVWSAKVKGNIVTIPNGLVLLQDWSGEIFGWGPNSPGGLVWDADYAIVSATNGTVYWKTSYYSWFEVPPWTPGFPNDVLPFYDILGSSEGYLVVQDRVSVNGRFVVNLLGVNLYSLISS